jgi:phosphopantetheinyl transferase
MPLFYQKDINPTTKLAIWRIEESEGYFLSYVPLQNNITHPHKRLQHLAGRYLLQYLFPDFPIKSIQIASTRKPFLEDEKYHFSISHCGNYAAAIVSSTHRIGIDIELERPMVAKIAHKFLHLEELNGFVLKHKVNNLEAPLPMDDLLIKIPTLLLLWCTKEAIFKWWGNGDVDFSEMIRIDKMDTGRVGVMKTRLLTEKNKYLLTPSYKIFDNLTLVWVIG